MSASPVSSIGAAFVAAANKASASNSGATQSASAAIAEANESKATTVKEAQNGDPVARKKLKLLQAKEDQQAAEAKASEPGKGDAVDKTA